MRTPLHWVAAACLALATPLLGQQTLVNFVPTDLNIPGANYTESTPDSVSSSQKTWNFDTDTPLFTTWIPIYGGIKVTNNSTLLSSSGTYARAQDAQVSGVAASAYLFSTAGGNGTTVNTVDMALLWKRQDFTNASGARVVFTANSTLSVNILNWNSTAAVPAQIRFIVKNGSQYYISEANRTSAGTLTLTNFSGNGTSGKRWALFNPTATSFGLPATPSGFQAVTFDDVQAVGWIGRGARTHSGTYVCDSFTATGSTIITERMAVGVNPSGTYDYGTAPVFTNTFRQLRSWLTKNETGGGPFDTQMRAYLALDANGWPTSVPFTPPAGAPVTVSQIAHSRLNLVQQGSYRLRFRGSGTFKLFYADSGGNKNKTFTPADIMNLPADAAGRKYWDTPALAFATNGEFPVAPVTLVSLEILSSSGIDYLKDFEFVHSNYINTDLVAQPFHPDYVAHLQTYERVLRTMNWANMNANYETNWGDRKRPNWNVQNTFVALEYMVAIANAANRDLWISVPTRATNTYMEKMAKAIRYGTRTDGEPYDPATPLSNRAWAPLNSNLKLFVEYSNETWNTAFQQFSQWAQPEGVRLRDQVGLPFPQPDPNSGSNFGAAIYYGAYRSAQMWDIFDTVFGSTARDRLVRVMGSQSSNVGVTNLRFNALLNSTINPTGQYPDVVSIAPYFANSVPDQLVTEGIVNTISDADLLARIRTSMETTTTPQVAAQAARAAFYGVYLDAYEAGQHLVSVNNTGNTALTTRITNINRHPGMKPIYADYLDMLDASGLVMCANFVDVGRYEKSGSWGTIEWLYQPYSTSYKLQPIREFIATTTRTNVAPLAVIRVPSSVTDANNNGTETVTLDAAQSMDYNGTVASVVWRVNRTSTPGKAVSVTLPVGVHTGYVTVIDNDGAMTQENFTITVAAP